MLADQEWDELLRYLIERLAAHGDSDTASEARAAATARIVERPPKPTEATGIREPKDAVGDTAVRPPTSKESFVAAFDALAVRLTQLPAMATRTSQLLGRRPEEIVWRSEDKVGRTNIPEASLAYLALEPSDRTVIGQMIEKVHALLAES